MITIDGSEGEGGGQVVRSALALSLATGQPFRIDNIRARRPKPGLMRQHLTAVEAACRISGATCNGAEVGSCRLTFTPGKVVAGSYSFAIGTAGSTGLVLQTILPALMSAAAPSTLVIEGGTHNPHAPPFDFIARTYLPLIGRFGPQVTAKLERHGFYPAGGGRIIVEIEPAPLVRCDFLRRGALQGCEARVLITSLPEDIARREIDSAQAVLNWSDDAFRIEPLPEDRGPGNCLLLETRFDALTEIAAGFGQLGVAAQAIGHKTATRLAGYLATEAFAGPYLADQLLLPMALADGGSFTTVKPSQHTLTNAGVIERFLGSEIRFEKTQDGIWCVGVS
jgi:RNA 3'-terminal phosphate cyclase (ATP)